MEQGGCHLPQSVCLSVTSPMRRARSGRRRNHRIRCWPPSAIFGRPGAPDSDQQQQDQHDHGEADQDRFDPIVTEPVARIPAGCGLADRSVITDGYRQVLHAGSVVLQLVPGYGLEDANSSDGDAGRPSVARAGTSRAIGRTGAMVGAGSRSWLKKSWSGTVAPNDSSRPPRTPGVDGGGLRNGRPPTPAAEEDKGCTGDKGGDRDRRRDHRDASAARRGGDGGPPGGRRRLIRRTHRVSLASARTARR